MIVGIVSDTHLKPHQPLPAALRKGLAGSDVILHAGDIACVEVLEILRGIAPVHAVCGNVDPPDLGLPATLELHLAGFTVGLVHGHLGPGRTTEDRATRPFPGAQVVVFGHSHRPLIARREDGRLIVNPGSPTQPRGIRPSYALLDLSGDLPAARLIPLADAET